MPERKEHRQNTGVAAGRSARPVLQCLAAALALLLAAGAALPPHAEKEPRERTAVIGGLRQNGPRMDKSIKETLAKQLGGENEAAESEAAESTEQARAYAAAAELLRAGRPGAAALAFRALGDYRNASELSAEICRC